MHTFHVVILICILMMITLTVFVVGTYIAIQWFDVQSHYYRVMYYNYTPATQRMIDTYGDMPITHMYLVREPFTPFIQTLLRIITGYKLTTSSPIPPFHYSLLFEIACSDGHVKLVRLEKNSSIHITPHICLQSQGEMIPFTLHNPSTINQLLNSTLKRVGHARFFNWSVTQNNCRMFIKEVLKTMNQYTLQTKSFIYSNKDTKRMIKEVVPTKFAKHVINTIVNVYDICIHLIP